MAFWGYRPVLPEFTIEDPKGDFRSAQVIEQYHLGSRALYIPGGGFSWKYIPLGEIRGVIPGRDERNEESAMGGYRIENPTIRLIHRGGAEVLTLESRTEADKLFSLLRRKY